MSLFKKNSNDFLFTSIKSLRLGEMYLIIKIKVIKKYDIQFWMTENDSHKFFKFNVSDDTGSIRVITCN